MSKYAIFSENLLYSFQDASLIRIMMQPDSDDEFDYEVIHLSPMENDFLELIISNGQTVTRYEELIMLYNYENTTDPIGRIYERRNDIIKKCPQMRSLLKSRKLKGYYLLCEPEFRDIRGNTLTVIRKIIQGFSEDTVTHPSSDQKQKNDCTDYEQKNDSTDHKMNSSESPVSEAFILESNTLPAETIPYFYAVMSELPKVKTVDMLFQLSIAWFENPRVAVLKELIRRGAKIRIILSDTDATLKIRPHVREDYKISLSLEETINKWREVAKKFPKKRIQLRVIPFLAFHRLYMIQSSGGQAYFNVRPYLYGSFGMTIARDTFTEADTNRAPMYRAEFYYLWKLGKNVDLYN